MTKDAKIKYIVGGLSVVLLLGGLVWFIRNEAERTRESIRDAAKQAGSEVRKGVVEGAERAVDKAGELPGRIIHDVRNELQQGAAEGARQAVETAGELTGQVADTIKDVRVGTPTPPRTERPADEPATDSQPTTAEPPPPISTTAKPEPPRPLMSNADATSDRTHQKAASAVDQEKEPARSVGPNPPERTEPSRAKPQAKPRGSTRPTETPQHANDPFGQLYDLGREVAKTVDAAGQEVLGLSLEEEKQLGPLVHKLICRDQKVLSPPALVQRLQKLAGPILELRSRKELSYHFLVLDSPEVNAFAHVGGYVYVTKGMLGLLKADTELQFVLAHEIAHIDLRHAAQRITYAARASEVAGEAAGTLAQFAYLAIALGYSEEIEFEADAWAMRAMLQTGHNAAESLSALRHLAVYVADKNLEPKRPAPRNAAERTLYQIQDHFRSHPLTEERLEQLEVLNAEDARKRALTG